MGKTRRKTRRHDSHTHTQCEDKNAERERGRKERDELDCFRDICHHSSDWSTCSDGSEEGVEEGGRHEEEGRGRGGGGSSGGGGRGGRGTQVALEMVAGNVVCE